MLKFEAIRPAPALYYCTVAAFAAVAGLAFLLAITPSEAIGEAFVLVDRNDSIHELKPVHRDALRTIAATAAALFVVLCLLLIRWREQAVAALRAGMDDLAGFALRLKREAPPPAGLALWVAVSLFLLGAALRLSWLDLPMRFDEADTYNFFASRNLLSLISDYTAPNNHILHNIAVHFVTKWFGSSPPVIRFPAFVAGLLLMPLTFVLARRWCGESAAVLAMALAAVSPPLVRYSTEARGYTMITACFLCLCLIAPYLAERRSPALWLLFGALTIVGGCTIPVMLYPVAAVSVWMALAAVPERRIPLLLELAACGAVCGAVAAAFYAPAAIRTGMESLVANKWVAPFTWPYFLEKLLREAEVFFRWTTLRFPAWCVALLAAGFTASLFRPQARRIVAVGLATFAALMLAQRVVPFARVFYFALPVTAALVAAGWEMALERAVGPRAALRLSLALALALGCFLGWRVWRAPFEITSVGFRQDAEAREIALHLAKSLRPDAAVLTHPTLSEPIRFYLLRNGYSRGRVVTFEDLKWRGRLTPFDKLWLVRRRSTPLPHVLVDAPLEPFTEPQLEFETEFVGVYSLERRRSP